MIRSSELLSPEQVERVHEASLETLESVGMLVRNAAAAARPSLTHPWELGRPFARAGRVDNQLPVDFTGHTGGRWRIAIALARGSGAPIHGRSWLPPSLVRSTGRPDG